MKDRGTTLEMDALIIGSASVAGNLGRCALSRFRATATYSYIGLGYTHRIFQPSSGKKQIAYLSAMVTTIP